MSLIVVNARSDHDGHLDQPVGVRSDDDGTVVAFGPHVTAADAQPGDRVIDAAGKHLIEPLVNAHTHAAMTLFRGYGGDTQLMEWLEQHIWPAEARLTDEAVYWGTRLAALEMVRSGTTHFFDMYWRPGEVARAAHDAGIRATVGGPLFDMGDPTRLAEMQDTTAENLEAVAAAPGYGRLVHASLTPHAIYTVSGETLAWAAGHARDLGIPIHIHFCETIAEVDEFLAANDGLSPTVYLDRLGVLGPDVILAHACVMTRADYELVAERGAVVATNPASNLKLASGRVFPYRLAREAGVAVGLGTDGASSNNSLDLFADLKLLALLQKHDAHDPTVLPAEEAMALAQGRQSSTFGGAPLAVGRPADYLLIDTDLPQMQPLVHPVGVVHHLVYAAGGEVVDTVVVDGKVLMQGRVVAPGADGATPAEVMAEARRCAVELLNP